MHDPSEIPATLAASEAPGDITQWLVGNAGGKQYVSEGHQPFLLSGANKGWLIVRGHIDIFTVALEGEQPVGSREHFVSVDEGDLILGFDFKRFGSGHGFLAVGGTNTEVLEFNWTDISGLVPSNLAESWVERLDSWIARIGEASSRDIPYRATVDHLLRAGENVELNRGEKISTRKGVIWIEAGSGELSFLSTEELFFENSRSSIPIPAATWLEAFEACAVESQSTLEMLQAGKLKEGIGNYHVAICNNEFISKRLLAVDEYNRLKTKAEYQEGAKREAMAAIASVLTPEYQDFVDVRVSGDIEPLLAACRLVGKAMGIDVVPHPDTGDDQDTGRQLDGIAKASRFRLRDIALQAGWWKRDHGPILAFHGPDWAPVALLPASATSYVAVNGSTGMRVPVNEELAKQLQPVGKVFYRPFPDGILNGWKIMKFGVKGLGREFVTVALMGIGLGLLGLVVPQFSRLIFDVVIPGAAQNQLLQMVAGLIATSFGILAFDLTRSVAVLRVEGKMDYSIQAALWDRLMNLPLNFFRNYTSGDLANRVYGVDTIRDLVSGTGISAFLGALSSLFYLIVLFHYSVPLAFVGLILVAIAMAFTVSLSVWQLSHQRNLYALVGKITSTVLQFISGVAKIRVAGAEDHAFKVWAKQFSEQRRLSFIVGRIQNAMQVFSAGFPVFCSLTIFGVLAYVQRDTGAATPPAVTTGEFIAFNAAFGIFLSSMLTLSGASLSILQIIPVYERFKPIIQAEPEIDDTKSYPGELNGEIEIYHVNFRYSEDGPMVLKNVSIHIKPGEFVAFVGPSGSGKSTLLRLLLGFEQPESGKIYYDGQDLSSLDLREVRQQIGVVLQTSRLMPTDIFQNIIGNRQLTVDDAWDAAKRAGLAEDIEKMPMQMHTVISEGGGAFSGGQKQRLMIARAIVHRPRMIFLDEATSALDNRAQAVVTDSMDRLQATRIVVAHRLSTIRNADRIFVLVHGRIEEQGAYDELMEMDGHFADLARRQIA